MNLVFENGIAVCRDEADGAIANGTRIVKVNSEHGDGNPDGALGIVIGSVAVTSQMRADLPRHIPANLRDATHCYWVQWDGHPKRPVFVVGAKIAKAS